MWLLALAALVTVVTLAVVAARRGGGASAGDPSPAGETAAPAPPMVAADGPGPSRVQGLVPAGFERSEAGAAAAATSYLATLQALVLASPAERDDALRRIAAADAPGVATEALAGLALFDASVAEARTVLPAAEVFVREVPIAYAVAGFHPDRVRVDVWSLGIVLIEGRTEATEVWSTNTVELVWERGDWHVWFWTRSPGPVPAASPAQPTPPSAVLDVVRGWEGYRYVPSS